MPSKCEHPSPNHSPDIFSVFYGKTHPAKICGYHAKYYLKETLALINPERITK